MHLLKRSFSYNAIVVVQSLLPHEDPTGRQLFDSVIEPEASRSGLPTQFVEVSTPTGLLHLLDHLIDAAEHQHLRPVVHLEMHGTKNGLLPGRMELSWTLLSRSLQRLNVATELNLLVTLATCYGAHLVNTIDPDGEAPFWGIVGPTEQVGDGEILRGYGAFYRSLAADSDLWRAFEQLRSNVHLPEHWDLYMAELILALAFGTYHARHAGPGAVKRAEKQILKQQRRAGRSAAGKRAQIRAQLQDHEAAFANYKRKFLMLDRYPGNESRFPLTMNEALHYYELDNVLLKQRLESDK